MYRTEIFYFSGTGNSLHVAKELQRLIPDCGLVPIVNKSKNGMIESGSDAVGFIFPIYAFTMPGVVKNFIKRINLNSASYIFAISTKGGSPSIVMQDLNKIIAKKGKCLDSYFEISMASNFIIKHGADSPAEIDGKETAMIEEIDRIRNIIENREKNCRKDPELNFFTEKIVFPFVSRIIMPLFGELMFSFYADDGCTGCGTCQKVCLSGKIGMKFGKPAWRKKIKCYYCFACINYCPVGSIQIRRSKTKSLGRYHHPAVKPDAISGQK
jgi:ferredoxin